MPIKLDDLKKVESSTVTTLALNEQDKVEAIIKVKPAGYIPANVRVRARIDSRLFTCELGKHELEALQSDPKVESVSISKKLKSSESP